MLVLRMLITIMLVLQQELMSIKTTSMHLKLMQAMQVKQVAAFEVKAGYVLFQKHRQ